MIGKLQARASEEPDFEDNDAAPNSIGKRKANHASSDARPAKKAKSAKKKTSKTATATAATRDLNLDTESGINTDFAHMDADLLADHLAQRTKRFHDELSLVELDERRVPASAVRSTTDFEPARTLDRLPDFLRRYSAPKRQPASLGQAPGRAGEKGAPHTLVLTGAGLRAADVARALRTFHAKDTAGSSGSSGSGDGKKGGKEATVVVAKLFAKHIKLDEAKKYVAATRMAFGVGTPKRIADLLDAGALSSAHVERILIDASHIDQKKRGILDMKELQPQLVELLNRPQLKSRYGTGPEEIELLFF